MVLISNILMAGLAAASVLQNRQDLERRGTGGCTGQDFAAVTTVGGSGTPFCESNWGGSYAPITNLTLWANDAIVTGIQAVYSDGTASSVFGVQSTYTKSIGVNYGAGDLWTRVSLYGGTGAASYLQHLYFGTTNGDVMNIGVAVANGSPVRHDQAVGSGVLFGFQGTTGRAGQIVSLGFLFLNSPIAEIQVTNVQFPDGPVGTSQGINPTDIGAATFDNTGTTTVQYQFNNQLTETQAYTFAQTYTSTFMASEGIALSFQFSLPGIAITAGSTTTFTWTTSTATTTMATFTESIQVQYNAQVVLNPGQAEKCVAIAGQGAGRFAYTSTVTITLQNGNTYSFPENGYLTVSAFSQGVVQCSPA